MDSLPNDCKHLIENKAFKMNFDSVINELENKIDKYWAFVHEHVMEIQGFVDKMETLGKTRLWHWDDYDNCVYYEDDENFDTNLDNEDYIVEVTGLDYDEFIEYLDENNYFKNGRNKHLLTVRYCAQKCIYKESDFV